MLSSIDWLQETVVQEPLPIPDRKVVVSLALTIFSYEDFIRSVIDTARKRESAYGCFANVHMVVEATQDVVLADAVNNAAWATPDGVPMLWSLQAFYGLRQERITGLDVLPSLLKEAAKNRLSVYFYGSTAAYLDHCIAYCAFHYPELSIAGAYSPPFRALTSSEEKRVIERITASGAAIVFVSLGCPKQEKWMATVSPKIPAVLLGIGGALPVLFGARKRAPLWMQRSGLEWLFRFIQEPGRLFTRYAVTNSLFIVYFLRQLCGKKHIKLSHRNHHSIPTPDFYACSCRSIRFQTCSRT